LDGAAGAVVAGVVRWASAFVLLPSKAFEAASQSSSNITE